MTANEKIKLKRKIKNTNRVMIKIFKTENGVADFKTWLLDKKNKYRILIAMLGMTEEQFIEEAIKTNVYYPTYEAVTNITEFMIVKATVYEKYMDTLDKTPFYWDFKKPDKD